MKEDTIIFEVLENGDLKATTDPISPANHIGAENLFRFLDEVTGSKGVRKKRTGKPIHVHTHDHTKAGQ